METIALFAAAGGLAWASGFRLYLTLFAAGLLGRLGYLTLPAHLTLLEHELVLAATALMTVIEFFADKVPVLDSFWDAVHTFLRIPAGAILAAGTLGSGDPALMLAAAVLGGAVASGAHLTKSGLRAFINTSPEPFSNWAASVTEDAGVLGGLWLAFAHPVVFLLLLALFLGLVAWLFPRLWRGLRRAHSRLTRRRGPNNAEPTAPGYTASTVSGPSREE